nr:nucleoporin [Quercus suber]
MNKNIADNDIAFHDTMKPSFTTNGILVYSCPGSQRQVSGGMMPALRSLIGEHKDVRFTKFVTSTDLDAPTLMTHQERSGIQVEEDKFPLVRAPELDFAILADKSRNSRDASALTKQEQSIWGLCSVLYDDMEAVDCRLKSDVPQNLLEELTPRLRLDIFTQYWAELVAPDVLSGIQRAKSGEEKALLHLTQNNVVAACEALICSKNLKLAMMISQLSGMGEGRRVMMSQQIKSWRDRKDWSEMSDAVRTLYSILAGEVCIVQGQTGAAEDKISEFSISRRFGLTWQQSFGLRAFYGGHATLAEAITAYTNDLDTDREAVHPTSLWDSVENVDGTNIFAEKEDTLMSLLRLYIGDADATAQLFDPLVVSGSAVKSRLVWQMAVLLQAKNICSLAVAEIDALTLSFSAEVEDAGNTVMAAWVLLHLQAVQTRSAAVQGLLQRHADRVITPDTDVDLSVEDVHVFSVLTQDFHIPLHMIYAARAPLAKSLGDEARQVYYLLQADQAQRHAGYNAEAQEIVCTVVGPAAIISKDYRDLKRIIQLFNSNSSKIVQGWANGTGVYNDFLRLMSLSVAQRRGREGQTTVQHLRSGLANMQTATAGKITLMQRVAVLEMTRVCEEVAIEVEGYTVEPRMEDDDVEMVGSLASDMLHVSGTSALIDYRRAMGIVVCTPKACHPLPITHEVIHKSSALDADATLTSSLILSSAFELDLWMHSLQKSSVFICARCSRARASDVVGKRIYSSEPVGDDGLGKDAAQAKAAEDRGAERGAMSRRLAALSEHALEDGGRSARKVVEEAGFSDDLKRELEERIANASFRSENARAFAQASMSSAAGKGTQAIAGAAAWTGDESIEDASLRMLTDVHKPLRTPAKIPGVRAPSRVDTGRSKARPGSGIRIASARDKTSVYTYLKDPNMTEEEREKYRQELKARFQPAARATPATIQGLASLANERIEDAIARGQFKNLPRGKKIERDYTASSPFINTTEYFMNKIIQKQEIVPPWIEAQQEVVSLITRFRGRLRHDWKRHAARTIASRGGTLQQQMHLADEHAFAESLNSPIEKKLESINTVSSNDQLSQITLTGDLKSSTGGNSAREIEVEIMEREINDDDVKLGPSQRQPVVSANMPSSESDELDSPQRHATVPVFRDSQWENNERSYLKAAVDNINTKTRSYNLMAPDLAKKPYLFLDRELKSCYADVAPQVADAIRERALAPKIQGVEVVGHKPGSVLEKFSMDRATQVYDERNPRYGFKEFWRDLFSSKSS